MKYTNDLLGRSQQWRFSALLVIGLACALLAPQATWAKNIWIEVVGIQELPKNIHDNFPMFYHEGASFVRACQNSRLRPECHLLINSDWQLASQDQQAVAALHLPQSTTPTRQNVLGLLHDALARSAAGDTIVFSLSGHGYMMKGANSCSILNSEESICDTDMAAIAQDKPAGVLLFINAETCFGGAFVDVSTAEICVAVRVDRRNGAMSADGFFWDCIVQNTRLDHLDRFSGPLGDDYHDQPIVASDSIKSLMCREARANAYTDWPQDISMMEAMQNDRPQDDGKINPAKILEPEKNTSFFCSDSLNVAQDHNALLLLNSQSSGFLAFLRQAQAGFDCEKIGFSGDLCQALKTVLGTDFYRQFEKLDQLTKQLLQASTPSEFKKLKRLYQSQFQRLLHGPEHQAWRQIEPCLFNVEQTITHEEMEYQLQRRDPSVVLFPRTFTQQDIRAAQACESQIAF